MMNVFRQLTAAQKWTLVCAHRQDKTNQADQIIGLDIAVTGRMRRDLPTLFSDMYFTSVKGDSKKAQYLGQTRPGGYIQKAKNSFKNDLDYELDLTITNWKDPSTQGLGSLIARYEKANQ